MAIGASTRACACVLAVMLATGAAAADRRRGDDLATAAKAKRARYGFTIEGGVTGMHPGRTQPLMLVVVNRSRTRIVVRSLTGRVHSTREGCPADNVVARPFRGRVPLRPRRRARIRLSITMRSTAPDACQGATFRLNFRGQAARR